MEELVKQYREGYSKFVKELEGLSEEKLLFKPSEKSWSIKEIIIHVSDAEMIHIHRMKAVLAEENPVLTAFDQDLWAERLNYLHTDHQIYLQLFKTMRDSFLPVLQKLTPQDYERIGTHNLAGPLTFKDILKGANDHIETHIGQIRRVKSQF